MVSERELSKGYFEGYVDMLSSAARAGAEARAGLGIVPASTGPSAPETGPNFMEASITIANTLIGAGVLGLPYALKSAGWLGLVVMMGATLITCFTAKMLVWSFLAFNEMSIAVESYDQLAEAVLGSAGGTTMKILTVLECYGLAICYLVLHTTNWPSLLSLAPDEVVVAGCSARVLSTLVVSCLALPTLLVRSSHLSKLAVVDLIATSSMFVIAIVAPLLGGLPAPDGTACPGLDAAVAPGSAMGRSLLTPSGLGLATGLSLFAFSGHATFPELYRAMPLKERPNYFAACDLGFAFAGGFYALFACIGYYFYGSCAADTATLNLMQASPFLGSFATLLVLTSTFVTISVVCVPVVRILKEAWLPTSQQGRDNEDSGESLLQPMRPSDLLLRIGLVVVAFFVAVCVPNFGFVVALMGAFTTMLISFILPVAFYMYACWGRLGPLAICANSLVIAVGFLGMVTGVQSTLAMA